MELNHTYLLPAQPTLADDGDYKCVIDVSDVALDGVTLLICLCGLVGNGAVLWLLSFCIRRNSFTIYILNLAFADFIFLLFMLISALLYIVDNISCSTSEFLNYLRSLLLLSLFAYNMGLYLLTAISIESIWNFLQQFNYIVGQSQIVFLLVCINSSINPFIYFLVGSYKRHFSMVSLKVSFQRVFEELGDNTACSEDTTMDTLAPVC
ncbi:mas-related G-protein coupled receptor member F-like isoform X2 [Dromaius novaehollandiae]|uniref:mas-related G-protein coupled receptor member F-like isoform X2 n=1 Tax=Dromaius novaehollandiae TaxID=8790 RepID=UPI00311D69A6